MRSIEEIKNKAWKERKDIPAIDTGSALNTSFKLFDQYREATKPKVTGGTVNPTISYGNVRENPVLKRKENTAKTYSQALEESRNKAKTLEMGAKLPNVIPPKGDVSKLILPDTGGGGTVNPTLKRNEVRTNYDYMTDREAAVYKYYRDRGQVEKAQEYLDALEMDVNQRAAMQKREDAKKLAEESWPVALYARAVGNIGQAAGAAYALAMEGADKPVDPYHPLMGGVNMNEGLYEGLMGDSTGVKKFVKEAGLAVFDWGTQAAALGPLTPYVMAAGAAAGNTKDALERGGTTDEAVMYGLAGGAVEAITEKLGYDRLFKYGANAIAKKLGYAGLFELSDKIADKGALAKFLWEVMPHGASEGLEEATSEFTNIVADTLVLGDNSQMKQIAQTAMENGATESEAVKTALQQGFLQVIYSGAIGAASGGVIAGGIGGLSRAKGRNALEMAGNPAGVAREAMTNAGKEVTKRINDMRSQGKAEVPEGTTQGNVLPEQGNVMGNSENTSMEQRQENKALRDFGEKYYYTEGQKVVNEEAERRGDTSFIPAFQTYYTAGLTGMKESDIKQTAETAVADKLLLNRAYEAGALDRKEDLEMRLQGTGKMTDTPGVVLETEAITEGQKAIANLVSETTGAEVWVVDKLKEGVRGTFDRNKGRITIALDSGQFAGTLFHESVHFIRDASPEGFDRLRQAVFSTAAAMKGMDLETYVRKYEKMYGEAYQQEGREIDFDQILEEMVADAFAEVAGNEKAMRALVTELKKENPSVLEKLKDFVDSLLKTLKSLVTDGRFSSFGAQLQKDIDFTERMAKMLAEEMKTAGEMQRGEKTSIKNRKQVFSDINLEADPEVPGTEVRLSYKNKNDLPLMENITQSKKEDNGKERESENRFSLKEPIEETKDLIAVHNLTGEKLRKLLDLQGIPMPSIAITKSDATAEDFGEISLVFRKDTIDPADERNKVFDADAWTPMFPMLDKEEYGKTRAFLEELVRTMQAQTKSGKNAQGFMGENTMRAAMANRFVSLGEIKEAREKLEHLPKKEFEALREEMNQRLFGVLEEIYDTGSQTGINEVYEMEDIGEQIQNMAEEVKGVPSARQIQQNLRKAGYPISMELAEQTARVLEEIKEMPTDFFEAKPERVVEFAEVAAAVVPDDLEVDLRKEVENKIPQVLEYEAGSKESRVQQLNRVQGVRFSIRETEDGKKVAVVDNDILSHVDTENWNKTEKEKARKAAVESLLRFQNGIVVDHLKYHVNKQSRDEYTRSNDAERLYRVDKEAYGDKMRLAAYIDDAIVAATNWKADENLKHDRKDKIVQFLHGETLIQSGDNQYVAKVIVGITTAGRYLFYDVEDLKRTKFKLKEESSTAVVGNDTVNAIQEDSSDQSVAQGKREVKDVSHTNDMDIYFSIREENVSYDRLIQKPDMKITYLDSTSMDGKERRDAVEKAKKSVRDKKHPRNTDQIQYIYCKDIEKDIQVGKKGIAHALQRKWVESGIAMTKLGDLLENAILVNELEPREGVKRAYVLLGYGKDENGADYPTYFVVNEYPTGNVTVEDLAVLYSSKTQKMEPYANNASMIAGKNPLLTPGSTISIEELLDKVNAIYSDILSQDVADHFGNTRRQTSLSGNVRFSIREEDISYDSLIEKADMPVVKLDSHAMDGKKRKDVYPIAKQSVRSRNHPDNTEEKQYVYNADIDRKILVGRGGIEHSLQRKWEETAVMMTKLGEILENAVEINRLKKRDEADEAYVLLGYGEDEQGNGYPAYFVVNIFPDGTNRLEYIDVLYSAKAKKIEPSANPIKNGNAAKARGDSAPSLSGSTISIKDLLEEVNILYSDILPQSVADHFGNTRRKTKLGESVLFSIREEEYDALVEENEALKEANEALRRQFEITKDAVHDPVSAKKAVRKWLKAHDSEYDVDDFTEKFVALADYVANSGDRVDFQKVMGALQKLAYDALSESKVLNTDLSDAYKDFKNEVRKTKIKVTDSMLEELEYYGGYIEFRKRNFGKLNLSRQSGIPADVFYQEMAEKYPGLLKEGNVKTQVDILIDLANTVDSLQPTYENPYGMNLDEYAMDAAYDLWEMYFNIEMQKPTFADKYEKKVEQIQIENQKLKAAKNKMRQEMKERHEEQMEKAKAEANKKLEEEREKYIRQVDVLLEEKYKLRQKLETQWKAHKNSMVEAQRTELARLIAEGKKTAAEIRELKKDKKELKQRMDEVLEKEDLWVQACQAILRENNKEINRYKKQVQRLKESKEKQRERAIRKYDRLLEAKFQLQDRQKKQSERRKYAKYRQVVEQETNKMLKWITKPTDTYHVPEEMTKGLKELLTKIGTSDGEIMIMQNDLFQAIKDLERFRPKDGKEEADFFVEHDEQTIDSMNEFIGKYPNGFDLENLPADEMKELADILRSIHKRITNANKFISLFRQVEVREVSEKFLSESQKMKNTVQEGRTRQVLDFFNMDLVDPYSFFSGMGDSVRNTLFKATEEGFERKIRHEAEAEKFISSIVSKKEAAAWSTAKPTLYKIGGRDIYMTPAEVMSLYATYRRNQGILHLLEGGFKTAFNKLKRMTRDEADTRLKNFNPYQPSRKEMEDIFETLTDKQKEVVEKAQDFLSNVVGGWGNETSMEMFGYKKFNDQRYFPISSDKDYINNVFGDPNQKQKALVNIAAARPTSDQAKNPIVIEDFFTVFARHIDQMSSYNAFVPVISDWNKFMGYKKYSREAGVQEVESVKKEISRTMGQGAISYIRKFLEDIQSVNTGEKAPITKTLVSNMKRASVGANLRVAIQQPVSIVRAADMLSPKYLMMAFAKGKNDFEKIYEYAPIAQWKEWGHYDMNIARGLEERIRGQSILGKISDYSMVMASWGDKFTWGRIWKAVEMETRDKYPDLKGERFDRNVGERFSEIINRTQVVDSMLHRSQIMREKTIYKQMTTSFMGEPIKTYNMMRSHIVELMKDNTKENRNKVVRSFVTLTFNAVAVAAAAAVVDALRDDDDDETWAEKWLEAFRGDYEKAESGGEKVMAFLSSNVGQNTNPFTYIPYLKDVVSLLQGYTVQRTDIGWVSDIIKSGNVLMQYIKGESPYTFTAVLANTAASLSKATGLPIASAKRDMEAIKNTVINQAMGLETQYGNKKLTYALGSEKNVSMYVKMMIDAKLSGNDKLATRIYNEMVNAGISNEKMESQLGSKEKEKIKKDSAAMEAVEAYAKKDYDTYTQKLDELRKKYSQKNIESTIRSMYEDKYGEEDIETFDKITQDFWEKEEEVESSQFKTVIDAMMEAKLSGKLGEATKLYNYMVNNGLPNDKLDSAIDSREKELLKNDPLTKEGAEAFHEGDADRYVDIVEQLKNKNYYARNVTSAIESMHDKLYGEDDEDTFETITQDFWEEDEADEMVSYELLFNAFWNGSRGTYNEVWGLLNAAGKEDKSIRASMRNRCYDAYWKAEGEGNTEEMNKAAAEYQRNGGKLETLLKPPKE